MNNYKYGHQCQVMINNTRPINQQKLPIFFNLKTGGPPGLINFLAYPRLINSHFWNPFFYPAFFISSSFYFLLFFIFVFIIIVILKV